MRTTHIVASVVLAVLAVAALGWLIPGYTDAPMSELDLPPAFMPEVAATVLLVCALSLLVSSLRAPREAAGEGAHEEFGEDASGVGARELRNVALWSVTAILTWQLIHHVGFEPALTLFLVAALSYTRVRPWWLLLTLALVTPIVLGQVAWYAFSIQLPAFWR